MLENPDFHCIKLSIFRETKKQFLNNTYKPHTNPSKVMAKKPIPSPSYVVYGEIHHT